MIKQKKAGLKPFATGWPLCSPPTHSLLDVGFSSGFQNMTVELEVTKEKNKVNCTQKLKMCAHRKALWWPGRLGREDSICKHNSDWDWKPSIYKERGHLSNNLIWNKERDNGKKSTLTHLFKIVLEVLSRTIKQEAKGRKMNSEWLKCQYRFETTKLEEHMRCLLAGFYVNLIQTRVILEERTSRENASIRLGCRQSCRAS